MKNLLALLILAGSINEGLCSAYPALTEQDRVSIASANLTEAQKLLTAHFVNYIREEGQGLGINPALAFGQSPTGINDREYRRERLEELREKREAQKFQIERLQSRGLREESLSRDEAVLLIAKQLGVSPDRTRELLARYEPKPDKVIYTSETEEDSQYVPVKDLFKDPTRYVSKKTANKAKALKAAEERAAQQTELRAQKEKQREELKQQKEAHRNDLRQAREERLRQKEEKRKARNEAREIKQDPSLTEITSSTDTPEQKTVVLHSPDKPGWEAEEPQKEIQ